jgi:hypothetical protein
MHDNPIADELERVLEYGSPPVVWPVPENASIVPGTGEHLLDGAVITHWTAD